MFLFLLFAYVLSLVSSVLLGRVHVLDVQEGLTASL